MNSSSATPTYHVEHQAHFTHFAPPSHLAFRLAKLESNLSRSPSLIVFFVFSEVYSPQVSASDPDQSRRTRLPAIRF